MDNFQPDRETIRRRFDDVQDRRHRRNELAVYVCLALVAICVTLSASFLIYKEITTAEPVKPGLVAGTRISCTVE